MTDASPAPVQVGILGLGRSGWNIHAQTLAGLPDRYTITAVTDFGPQRVVEAEQTFGCTGYDDMSRMLADERLDLIVVASPNHLHAEHAIAAMESGYDVVCEKPMALSVAEADRMVAAAERTGRRLAPFQNLRYAPDFEKVGQVIESGVLGRIVQIRMCMHGFGRRWDWQTLREFGGGELNNTGPHLLDQALVLFGDGQPDIFCHADRALTSGDAEDHVKVVLRGPGAPLVEVEITRSCAFPQSTWLVMGTSGGLTGSIDGLSWKYVDFSTMPDRPVEREPTPDRGYNREELHWTEQTWMPETQDWIADSRRRFYEDLSEAIHTAAPARITPEQVRRQIAVLEQCHQQMIL